jgi:hypothetical protein
MKRLPATILLTFAAWLLLAACTGTPQTNREATREALGRAVVLTATADVDDEVSPQRLLATAEAAATEAVATISAAGTQAASLARTAEAVAALQPAAQPLAEATPAPPVASGLAAVEFELRLYDVEPAAGGVTWIEEEAILAGPGLQQEVPDDPAAAVPLRDFVLVADVALVGEAEACGFTLRATGTGEFESYYLVLIDRGGPMPITFQAWHNGALAPDEVRGAAAFNPAGLDPAFSLDEGASNRLAVVAQGGAFVVYSNGVRVGAVRPLLELAEGVVAFTAVNHSETAVCRFQNAWLWLTEE